jgi:polysaccharide export outer membrane protein
MRKNTLACLVVAGLIVVGTSVPPALAQGGATAPDTRYQLQNGDVIELNFPHIPSFNQTLTVQPDGYVTLQALGAFRAKGLTVPELTDALRTKYTAIMRDPEVTVALKEFEKPYFIVAGEVHKPGKYDLRGETTLTQAVAIAGGFSERAKSSRVAVYRRLAGGAVDTRTVDLKKMLNHAQLAGDVRLEPGDMVFIPRGRRVPSFGEVASSLWLLSWF